MILYQYSNGTKVALKFFSFFGHGDIISPCFGSIPNAFGYNPEQRQKMIYFPKKMFVPCILRREKYKKVR